MSRATWFLIHFRANLSQGLQVTRRQVFVMTCNEANFLVIQLSENEHWLIQFKLRVLAGSFPPVPPQRDFLRHVLPHVL
eukprot:767937-Hanusia_phi.AAC.7